MKDSNVVDWDDPDHNMYGCAPCPKCGGKFRASYLRASVKVIECECGHTEPAARDAFQALADEIESGEVGRLDGAQEEAAEDHDRGGLAGGGDGV